MYREKPNTEVDFKSFFERPRKVASINMSSVGTTLNVFQLWRTLPQVLEFVNNWQLFRGDLQVDFMVTGSSQFIGKWRACAAPQQRSDTYNDTPWNNRADISLPLITSQLPHVDFDLSMVGSYQLKLAYPHQYPFMGVNMADWYIGIHPVNPLKMVGGTTVPAGFIDVYVSYHGVVLDNLIPQGGDDHPGLISSIARYSASIARSLPFAWATPASKVLSLGAELAAMMGYSRPPCEIESVMQRRLLMNQTVVSGQVDSSYTLGADPRAMTSVDASTVPMGKVDDVMLKTFLEKRTQVRQDWLENSVWTVSPVHEFDAGILGKILPPYSYASAVFSYYSGGFDLCLEVISSPLLRGRLALYVFPPGVNTAGTPETGTAIKYVIDVTGSTCFDFHVPFMGATDFLPVIEGASVSVGEGFPTVKYVWEAGPYGPAATTVFPYINLYQAAAPDFQLGVPTLSFISRYTVDLPFGTRLKWNLQGYGSKAQATFGEKIESVLELAKRRCDYIVSNTAVWTTSVRPIPADGTYKWSYLTWFALCYLGERGSVSWTIIPTSAVQLNAGLALRTDTDSITGISSSSYGLQRFPVGECAEIRVPSRNPTSFRVPASGPLGTAVIPKDTLIVQASSADARIVMVGGGDDYFLSGFLCTPLLKT